MISAEINRKRVKASNEKVERINISLPIGTFEKIESMGFKRASFCREAILKAIGEEEEMRMAMKKEKIRVLNKRTGETIIELNRQYDVISELIDEIAENGSASAEWIIETESGYKTNIWYEVQSWRGDDGFEVYYGLSKEKAMKEMEDVVNHESSRDHFGSRYEVNECNLRDFWECRFETLASVAFRSNEDKIDELYGDLNKEFYDKWLDKYVVTSYGEEIKRFLTEEEAKKFVEENYSPEEVEEEYIQISIV